MSQAGRAGASQAEVFAVRSVTTSVYVDDTRIKICEEKEDQGIAMRVLKGCRLAQVSSTCVFEPDGEACAKVATMLADRAPSSGTYDRFPSPSSASSSPQNWDGRIGSLPPSELIELVRVTLEAAADRGAKVPRGVMRTATVQTMVLNTNGVDVSHRSTLAFASYNAMVDGSSPGEGVISFASPWLKDYDPARTGERLAQQALSCREAAPFEGRANGPVMISPWELEGMLSTSLCEAVRAESVNKRRSPWGQMEGQKVASDHLTIVDDPSDPRGLLSAAFDDEGVPTSVKTVVGKGVLRSFLYDSYNASVSGKDPSGNGMRRQPLDAQYQFRGPLRCSHLNLVIRPGTRSLDEMVSSIDDGLVVERFAFPTVNAQTGAFSLEVRSAYLVRRGAPAGHIKHALVTGNLYDGLRNIIEVGSDAEVVGDMILPSLMFDGFEVIGSR